MKILALNCGSSSLKFQLVKIHDQKTFPFKEEKIATGIVDRIGRQKETLFKAFCGSHIQKPVTASDHSVAAELILDWLFSQGFLKSGGLQAVGHRVVHGGDHFFEPTLINNDVIKGIEEISHLAPLHNRLSLDAIRAALAVLESSIPQFAVFDTSFHHTIPDFASTYAIPLEIARKYRIRKYGFHGLAHRYMTKRFSEMTGMPLNQIKLITLQLGNGCSATAIKNGQSVDTSMGFTPLEGLIMGTRSGDLDPALIGYLMRQKGMDIEAVEELLNKKSGLLGISGYSLDMRELLDAEKHGETRAALALEMFCYRIRKYIGAYLAALSGAHALIFGGGIGENTPSIRARICAGMAWYGLELDEVRNMAAIGSEGQISKANSRVHAYVIPVSETSIIIYEIVRFLNQEKGIALSGESEIKKKEGYDSG